MKVVDQVRCVCRSSAKCAYCMMRDGQLDVRKAANGVVDPFRAIKRRLRSRLDTILTIVSNFGF